MAFRGNEHGGNGKSAGQVRAMQTGFVENVIAGAETGKEAAIQAGFAPANARNVGQIAQAATRTGALQAALEKHGIDENWLVEEYKKTIHLAEQDGAREKDLNAKSNTLKNLSFLMGHGKQSAPAVAVQINNGVTSQTPVDDHERIRILAQLFAEEIELRKSSGVHPGGDGTPDAAAHARVVESPGDAQEASGGGQP